ncbi:hypothetical protein Moror_2474 [Moniliophthora roreri MCA 2997]|uniref:Uncharacterized protein n=1 Tax=Moniliophthora roreri (strain MCA 2997) TaxID=1381753 RepID=V2WFX8_MONRO|nr:hypothetical protein Moror_2474 [Moniliophthora roreri MCA 2997]
MSAQTSTEFFPKGPKLPRELFDMIIDQSRDNKPSLQELSLVSKAFCRRARLHLFRSIEVTCAETSGEPYQYEHFEEDDAYNQSLQDKYLTINEFVGLCESPHSTWEPGVIKRLELFPCLSDAYSHLLLLTASNNPKRLLDPIATILKINRTRDIFQSVTSLQLIFGDAEDWYRIPPYRFISTTFPSIRCLSLKSVRFASIEDLWDIFLSMPLLEEFEWIGGESTYWSPPATLANTGQQLPNLRSFSFQGDDNIRLGDLMPVLSALPKSHLSRYELCLAGRSDFPPISKLMTMAGSDGPVKQQWSFKFSPNKSRYTGYDLQNSEHRDHIVEHLCSSWNSRVSQLTFANETGWVLVPEVLERISSSNSNLESIILPPFMVDKSSGKSGRLSELKRIDKILDHDAFSCLQELHLHSIRYPGSDGKPSALAKPPRNKKTRSARWGRYERVLKNIEKRCVPRAVKKGIWKLHTTGKEWHED